MKSLVTFLLTISICISSYAQNGFYLIGYMDNAPDFSVQVDVNILTYSNFSLDYTYLVESDGNFGSDWIDLPDSAQIQAIVTSFVNCCTIILGRSKWLRLLT